MPEAEALKSRIVLFESRQLHAPVVITSLRMSQDKATAELLVDGTLKLQRKYTYRQFFLRGKLKSMGV